MQQDHAAWGCSGVGEKKIQKPTQKIVLWGNGLDIYAKFSILSVRVFLIKARLTLIIWGVPGGRQHHITHGGGLLNPDGHNSNCGNCSCCSLHLAWTTTRNWGGPGDEQQHHPQHECRSRPRKTSERPKTRQNHMPLKPKMQSSWDNYGFKRGGFKHIPPQCTHIVCTTYSQRIHYAFTTYCEAVIIISYCYRTLQDLNSKLRAVCEALAWAE